MTAAGAKQKRGNAFEYVEKRGGIYPYLRVGVVMFPGEGTT